MANQLHYLYFNTLLHRNKLVMALRSYISVCACACLSSVCLHHNGLSYKSRKICLIHPVQFIRFDDLNSIEISLLWVNIDDLSIWWYYLCWKKKEITVSLRLKDLLAYSLCCITPSPVFITKKKSVTLCRKISAVVTKIAICILFSLLYLPQITEYSASCSNYYRWR